jgi:hypothetical protein
MQHVKDHII